MTLVKPLNKLARVHSWWPGYQGLRWTWNLPHPEWTGPGFMLHKGSASVSSVQPTDCELISRCAEGRGSCLVPGRPPTRTLSGPMVGKTGLRPQRRAAGKESQAAKGSQLGPRTACLLSGAQMSMPFPRFLGGPKCPH